MQPTIGDNLANHRRRQSVTQEQLAERAGVSVETVRKLESNARTSARIATVARLARALGIPTSALFGSASAAAARREPHSTPLALVGIRRALTPALGLDGQPLGPDADSEDPTVDQTRESVRAASRLYHTNEYGPALDALPGLLGEVRALLDVTDGSDRAAAHTLAAQAYQLGARLLIQLRAHDLAYSAIRAAGEHGAESGDDLVAASVVGPMCWLLLRQARLGEAEHLAAAAADQIEPTKMSRASTERVAAWGWLLIEAAAAAARDGRDDDAREQLDLAAAAAARVEGQPATGLTIVDGFGPGKVAALRAEVAALGGDPTRVLDLAGRVPADDRRMTASCWQRHRLDVAWAHTEMGAYPEALTVLVDLQDRAPSWLRQQKYARDIVATMAAGRRRAMGSELSSLATLVGC
ncbi:helix-turn-helix transcriptional regulator [Micromonospora sp. WMMD1102]|uniref:helix-turn-helix domain-containing protein n=1 Tax=Micromonospora sp. WMMD1102 TaxID=3016105 RepID=UPI002414E897|nr:helix-turn-helix transcriptional regulator [Micromonospora sp. WMMD1102]MDG4784445.1 helix-turn-helix transcriptional regulator [Micromonospora sp. WMMD1102]